MSVGQCGQSRAINSILATTFATKLAPFWRKKFLCCEEERELNQCFTVSDEASYNMSVISLPMVQVVACTIKVLQL